MRKDPELAKMVGYNQQVANPSLGRNANFLADRRKKKVQTTTAVPDSRNEIEQATLSIEANQIVQSAESASYNLRSARTNQPQNQAQSDSGFDYVRLS